MLDRPRIVVVNTTPLIALAEIQQFDLLRQLYGEILVPSAVRTEILKGGVTGIGVEEFARAEFIRVCEVENPRRCDYLSDLDRGEAEVIALAEEKGADLVIIDELLGRKHAQRLGMTVTGSMGILVKAKQLGLIPRVMPYLKMWRATGRRWISESLQEQVLQMVGEENY